MPITCRRLSIILTGVALFPTVCGCRDRAADNAALKAWIDVENKLGQEVGALDGDIRRPMRNVITKAQAEWSEGFSLWDRDRAEAVGKFRTSAELYRKVLEGKETMDKLIAARSKMARAHQLAAIAGPMETLVDAQRLETEAEKYEEAGELDRAITEVEKATKTYQALVVPNADASLEYAVDLADGVKMDFVLIPPGYFTMGDPEYGEYCGAVPVHKVTITRPFYMGKYEVTQKQWRAVMGDNPSSPRWDPTRHEQPQHPVGSVSWKRCQVFVQRLNNEFIDSDVRFSLPSEAQWEYACRAGSTGKFCCGYSEASLRDYAWFRENSGGGNPHPVGEKKANAWGLYDMHGNVREWCADWYDKSYYKRSPPNDPAGPSSGSYRVVRGGTSGGDASGCRSGGRDEDWPASNYNPNGFRVVCIRIQ